MSWLYVYGAKRWRRWNDEGDVRSHCPAKGWEAECILLDCFQRWTMPIGFEARESDEPVNYTYDFEKLEERHVPCCANPH